MGAIRHEKRVPQPITANENIVAESMTNIDAEYEALCASNAAVAV